eukprot:TRINITY_DN6300_c0_g1_i1.p1 TRINITY_DN6300_c0_g1~~TRINITY_DN6300_c0_g1_i1.p1  ORF type:complete len:482 (-),score=71.78 TRINITY_DN6300_c0_g1_i1:31-1476(-)
MTEVLNCNPSQFLDFICDSTESSTSLIDPTKKVGTSTSDASLFINYDPIEDFLNIATQSPSISIINNYSPDNMLFYEDYCPNGLDFYGFLWELRNNLEKADEATIFNYILQLNPTKLLDVGKYDFNNPQSMGQELPGFRPLKRFSTMKQVQHRYMKPISPPPYVRSNSITISLRYIDPILQNQNTPNRTAVLYLNEQNVLSPRSSDRKNMLSPRSQEKSSSPSSHSTSPRPQSPISPRNQDMISNDDNTESTSPNTEIKNSKGKNKKPFEILRKGISSKFNDGKKVDPTSPRTNLKNSTATNPASNVNSNNTGLSKSGSLDLSSPRNKTNESPAQSKLFAGPKMITPEPGRKGSLRAGGQNSRLARFSTAISPTDIFASSNVISDYSPKDNSSPTSSPSVNIRGSPGHALSADQIKVVAYGMALYANESPDDEKELVFKEGDILSIYSMEDPEWWIAGINDKVGFVPAEYIQIETIVKSNN